MLFSNQVLYLRLQQQYLNGTGAESGGGLIYLCICRSKVTWLLEGLNITFLDPKSPSPQHGINRFRPEELPGTPLAFVF